MGLCEERNTGADEREHEARLEEEAARSACGDSRAARLRLGWDDDNRRLDGGGSLLGGYCPAGLVLVIPGRVRRGRRARGAGGGVDLWRLVGRAVGCGRVALGDGDGHRHGRGRGGGDILINVASHGHSGAGDQDGEDAPELHVDR